MHPNKVAERTAYYRQQASVCSTAALTTTIAEVRQAYLELEQGWLCLAPKSENSSTVSAEPNATLDAHSEDASGVTLQCRPVVTGQHNP
jgi:hypothetical protein